MFIQNQICPCWESHLWGFRVQQGSFLKLKQDLSKHWDTLTAEDRRTASNNPKHPSWAEVQRPGFHDNLWCWVIIKVSNTVQRVCRCFVLVPLLLPPERCVTFRRVRQNLDLYHSTLSISSDQHSQRRRSSFICKHWSSHMFRGFSHYTQQKPFTAGKASRVVQHSHHATCEVSLFKLGLWVSDSQMHTIIFINIWKPEVSYS